MQSTETTPPWTGAVVGTAQAAAVTQVRRGVQLIAAVADCVAPHARRPPQWSPVHEAIVTGRVEGRFRLGLRVADLTMLLIGSDGREMTRCPLDGLPVGIAGQTLLRGIQGHFGLHGHTLTKAPAGTFQLAAVEAALAEGDRPVELARLALAG